jgi:hypothetical protein
MVHHARRSARASKASATRSSGCSAAGRVSAFGSEGRSFTGFSVASHSLIWLRLTSNAQKPSNFQAEVFRLRQRA